ncbi:MAG: glycosyltransferase [Bilophila wadsworthia]
MQGANYTFFTQGAARPAVEFAQSRVRNLCQLNALAECDLVVTATSWQKKQYPQQIAKHIHVIHEGVDTDFFSPKPERFRIEGCDLSTVKELVTFSGRGLEPFRGFPQFYGFAPVARGASRVPCADHGVRAAGSDETVSLERLRERCLSIPAVAISWGSPTRGSRLLLRAYGACVFYGTVRAFGGAVRILSCGCLLVSSDTEPVREVVRHGENGFLCDFWDHDMLADMTTELLARSDAMGPVRAAARQSIVEEYNLKVQIPRHMDLLLSTYADWKKARQTS